MIIDITGTTLIKIGIALAAVMAAILSILHFSPPAHARPKEKSVGKTTQIAPAPSYDWEASRRNLERIGAALQLYREEVDVLPAASRNTYVDAGLPYEIFTLARSTNRAWSIEPSSFQVTEVQAHPARPRNEYMVLYKTEWNPDVPGFDVALRQRGDRLPILMDFNMYSSKQSFHGETVPVLILRLDGTVEQVEFTPYDYSALLQR